ncbi:hypothetical protein H4R34_001971 [Dimargaris verticillata]|uniref:Intimal thickness related receptor IRP domain-containing protein n=1 Tax=Dimargaris verticillata TaxID=2761393 RepID=A0A9W8EE00_9FUNG|nr:hypothetical protein H4R34_001971 [Dimargaris verticillata]
MRRALAVVAVAFGTWARLAQGTQYACIDCVAPADEPLVWLTTFGFQARGRGELSLTNFMFAAPTTTPQQNLQNITFVVIPESAAQAYVQVASNSGHGYCQYVHRLEPTYSITFQALYEQAQGAVGNDSFADHPLVFHPNSNDIYSIFLLNCSNATFQFNAILNTFNYDTHGQRTHLPLGHIELPLLYQVFGLGLWAGALLGWAVHTFRRRAHVRILWVLIGAQLFSQLARCAVTYAHQCLFSRWGHSTKVVVAWDTITAFIGEYLTYLLYFVVAKGWGLMRSYLTVAEWRVVLGSVTFIAVGRLYYAIVGKSSWFTVLVLQAVGLVYIAWNIRWVTRTLHYYLQKLEVKLRLNSSLGPNSIPNSPSSTLNHMASHLTPVGTLRSAPQNSLSAAPYGSDVSCYPHTTGLMECYTQKRTLLSHASRTMLGPGALLCLITLVNHFILADKYYYIATALQESILFLQCCYLGYLFRPRNDPVPHIVLPSLRAIRLEQLSLTPPADTPRPLPRQTLRNRFATWRTNVLRLRLQPVARSDIHDSDTASF